MSASVATYIGKPCPRCGSRERYMSSRNCAACARARWHGPKNFLEGSTRAEAELQAEAIVAFWKERGKRVDVAVEPLGPSPCEAWTARIVTPMPRGWPRV